MESKQKIKRVIMSVVIVIAVIVAVMAVSFVRGNQSDEERKQETVSVDHEQNTAYPAKEPEQEEPVSKEEALGMVTGEDDDFTLTVNPANFNVTIQGYDKTASTLASSEKVCHDQMREWMDENEFWDMTEVVYTGKYLRDEAGKQTTLYFQISRYPNSPLCATWHEDTGMYSFEIDWQ